MSLFAPFLNCYQFNIGNIHQGFKIQFIIVVRSLMFSEQYLIMFITCTTLSREISEVLSLYSKRGVYAAISFSALLITCNSFFFLNQKSFLLLSQFPRVLYLSVYQSDKQQQKIKFASHSNRKLGHAYVYLSSNQ